MSAPAANALSDPVSTVTRTLSSRSNDSSASTSSLRSSELSALSALGRFSVTMATAPSRLTRMFLYSMAHLRLDKPFPDALERQRQGAGSANTVGLRCHHGIDVRVRHGRLVDDIRDP